MSDQPEPVGFEAYFETKQFESGMKRFISAIDSLRVSINRLDGTLQGFALNAKKSFDAVGKSAETMSSVTKRQMEVAAQAARDGGVLIGQSIEKESGDGGTKGGKAAGDNLITALLGATLGGGGIRKAGGAIGAILGASIGAALGTSIGGPAGTAIGGQIGSIVGGAAGGTKGGAGAIIAAMFGPIGIMVASAKNSITSLLKIAKPVFDGIASIARASFTVIGAGFSVIGDIGKFIFSKIGDLGRSAFRMIKTEIGEIIAEFKRLVGEVANLQKIEAGIDALVKSALVAENQFKSASDAINASVPITEKLRVSLAQIALSSPFGIQQINDIFRTNAAFGISLSMSLKLTESMIEFGSATGFTSDSLNLIARNLAQIAKFGHVYTRDIYQLANAGVDLALIVRQELGMSIDELNTSLSEGATTMDDLMNAFIAFGEKNYAGAAESLSLTIYGLKNRLETLKVLITQDFISPFLERAAGSFDIFLNALRKVYDTGVFELLGQTFSDMMAYIFKDTSWTIDSVALKIMSFIEWLVTTSADMLGYGYDMMEQWGFGMLRGAAAAITAVANFIANTISDLFSTHSPPKILPLIDAWGAGTIQAWLEGMTKADFGVIDNIISPIESALSNLGLSGPEILGNLQNVVKRISGVMGGGSDANLLGFIGGITGPFGNALKELTRLEFRLADAIKAVAQAQDGLNDATQMYEDADETVRNLVREYNRLLRAGASDDILDAKVLEIRAAQNQRKEAARLIEQREEELKIAEENKTEMEGMTDAQRDMVDLMIKLTKSSEDAGRSVGGLGSELENAFSGITGGVGAFGDMTKVLDDKLKPALTRIKAALEELKRNWELLVDSFKRELGIGPTYDELTGLPVNMDDLSPDYDVKKPGLIQTFSGAFGALGDAISGVDWKNVSWETFKENLKTALTQAVKDVLSDQAVIDAFTNAGISIVKGITAGLVVGAISVLPSGVRSFVLTVMRLFSTYFGINGNTSRTEKEVGEPIVNGIITGMGNKSGDAEGESRNVWTSIKNGFNDAIGPGSNSIGGSIVRGIISGMLGLKGTLIGWAVQLVLDVLAAMKRAISSTSPSKKSRDQIGIPLAQGIGVGFMQEAHNLKRNIAGVTQDLINFNPTPTNAFTPSAISNTSVNNTFNMGGNVVRDDMDLAVINNGIQRQLRQATYGV